MSEIFSNYDKLALNKNNDALDKNKETPSKDIDSVIQKEHEFRSSIVVPLLWADV